MPYSHLHRSHHFLKPHGELHVIAVVFNPQRYISRYTHAREFLQRAKDQGAIVTLAEAAFGNRPFELDTFAVDYHGPITAPEHYGAPHHIVQYRIRDELWLKESIINATISKLPADWKYVAWIDADVAFVNPFWAQETIQQLQHYSIVQMFHTAMDLTPDQLPLQHYQGFPSCVFDYGWDVAGQPLPVKDEPALYYMGGIGKKKGPYFHPGYAWACTREAWDTMGGLIDVNVVGGADYQMAYGLYGKIACTLDNSGILKDRPGLLNHMDDTAPLMSPYSQFAFAWQEHAAGLKHNVGFVPGTLLHYWHGQKAKRTYNTRYKIMRDNQYDPHTDLKKDWQGIWQLAGNKPQLRDDLRVYFRSRSEDGIDM